MLNLLGEQQPETLKLPPPVPLALHPAAVYLDSLGSDSSKATMGAGSSSVLLCVNASAVTIFSL
ncbi:hypothetical protein QUA54_27720 [Microcoleus sp. MOSTC5]|uniref:hypothetical protein n=1 Tax=Microcoleus sp. MOSTC5 TaxID=3055378 RepID=UPI002FCF87AA